MSQPAGSPYEALGRRDRLASRDGYLIFKRTIQQVNFDLFGAIGYAPRVDSEKLVILAHIHCLTSSYFLLRHMVRELGVPANNIILLPKPYSSIAAVIHRIQALGIKVLTPQLKTNLGYDDSMEVYVEDVCRLGYKQATDLARQRRKGRVILVDDGGALTRQWLRSRERRYSIDTISIQQTRSGVAVLGEKPAIPVINVAQSAAKRRFESHYIAKAIVKKTQKLGYIKPDRSIGVFGLGMIGRAVAKALLGQGHEIHVCDERASPDEDDIDYWHRLREASSRKNFVNSCDLIFGATSADWLRDDWVPRQRIATEKVLVSCSSRDREFHYVLRQPKAYRVDDEDRYTAYNSYADVLWHPLSGQKPFRLLNGGFPINFDRQREWEPFEDIALTRVLVLAAVVQGICTDLASTPIDYIQLDAYVQRKVTQGWMSLCNKTARSFFLEESSLRDVKWWIKASEGVEPDTSR